MANVEPRFVTIILPVRNEGGRIVESLGRIFSQDYPSDRIEVIVADGCSDDDTPQMITEYAKRHSNLRLVRNPGRIVPTGLNLALAVAKGEIVVRVDGHCVIPRDYISKCVGYLADGSVSGVGGSVVTIGEGGTSDAIAATMCSLFGVGDSAFRTLPGKSVFADTIPFPAYPRKTIEQAGLYDEELVRCQDDEYNYRIRELGGRLLLAKDIASTYYSRSNLATLWKQYFQYGFYKVRVLQKHRRQMRPRQFVPPLFVLSLILSLCLVVLFPWGWISFAVVAGCYVLADLVASIVTAAKKGWKHLLLLPVVFAILHVSYGLGLLSGLVKFWNRWGDKEGKVPEFRPWGTKD